MAPDNVIPRLFADRIAGGGSMRPLLLGDWHTSDRPPLQTGIVLLQYPLYGNRDLGYQLLGTIAQVSWVVALWALLRARGFGHSRILAVVLIVAATGFMFFSNIYVWPKLLAASLCLCALANLVSRHRADRRPIAGVYAGVAVAMAMLAHGGTVFSVLALVPFGFGLLQPRFRRALLIGGAVALGLYLPWVLYQHYVDPPGDRLIKWHLAGIIPVDPRSASRAVLDQYAFVLLSLAAWVLLEWGGEDSTTIIQAGPYAAFLVLLALLALALLALPTIAMGAIVAVGVGWFLLTWLPLPGFRPSSNSLPAHAATDWAMALLLLVALAGFGWLGATLRRSERIAAKLRNFNGP
jgi:hypothetical protein